MAMTIEQQRAIAMANARMRAAQAEQGQPPAEGGYSETAFAQGTSGLNEGIANMLGTPVDLMNLGVKAGAAGINKVFGTDIQPSDTPLLGSKHIKGLMTDVGSIQPESDSTANQMIRRTAESVGSSLIPAGGAMAGATKPLQVGAGVLASSLAGGASAATAQQAFPDNPTAEMVAEWVGSLGTAGATAMLKKAVNAKKLRDGVASAEDLRKMSSDLYEAADARGVVFDPAANRPVTEAITKAAMEDGLDPTLHPRAVAALKRLDEYSAQPMTVTNARTVQRILGAAAKDPTNPDQTRIAVKMKQAFDEYLESQVPEIAEANALYSRVKKADKLDEIRALAASRSGQFTGSGYENALRTEMRGLERNIIKGREKRFSEAERKAITDVAQGTQLSNTFRNLGKAAPTGSVSFGVSAGVPFAIGNAFGGPAVGGAASALTVGGGFLSREMASHLGQKGVERLDLMIRNGGILPNGTIDRDFVNRAITAILLSNIANSKKAD